MEQRGFALRQGIGQVGEQPVDARDNLRGECTAGEGFAELGFEAVAD